MFPVPPPTELSFPPCASPLFWEIPHSSKPHWFVQTVLLPLSLLIGLSIVNPTLCSSAVFSLLVKNLYPTLEPPLYKSLCTADAGSFVPGRFLEMSLLGNNTKDLSLVLASACTLLHHSAVEPMPTCMSGHF